MSADEVETLLGMGMVVAGTLSLIVGLLAILFGEAGKP